MQASPVTDLRRFHPQVGWHVVGGVLVAFWLVVMGMMFVESRPGSDAIALSGGDLSAGFAVGEESMAAYYRGRKLGYVHSKTERVSNRLHLEQESRLEVEVGGARQKISTDLRVILADNFYMESFDFELRTGILDMTASGRMEAGRLQVEVDLGGEKSKKAWPLDEPPLFDLAVPKMLAQRNLRSGQRYRVTVFDPQSMSNRETLIEVIGREAVDVQGVLVPGIHLRQEVGGAGFGGSAFTEASADRQVDTWIGEQGEVLRQDYGFGLTLRRAGREEAGP